jgi:hypothetical protein
LRRDCVSHAIFEDVQSYSGAPFEYPKPVTERLIELARAFLASQADQDLSVLLINADITRNYYDAAPYPDDSTLELVVEGGNLAA